MKIKVDKIAPLLIVITDIQLMTEFFFSLLLLAPNPPLIFIAHEQQISDEKNKFS